MGTMAALVWAQDVPSARLRVAHDCFHRDATLTEILARPIARHEPVAVRLATDADRALFEEWSREVVG